MSVKTWFQHDCNARKGKGLSIIIGKSLPNYARFWILNELLCEQNLTKDAETDTLKITESSLIRELKMSRKRLATMLKLFRVLGVKHKTFLLHGVRIFNIALPKSLIYMKSRRKKRTEREIDKEREKTNVRRIVQRIKNGDRIYKKDFDILPEDIRSTLKKDGDSWIGGGK